VHLGQFIDVEHHLRRPALGPAARGWRPQVARVRAGGVLQHKVLVRAHSLWGGGHPGGQHLRHLLRQLRRQRVGAVGVPPAAQVRGLGGQHRLHRRPAALQPGVLVLPGVAVGVDGVGVGGDDGGGRVRPGRGAPPGRGAAQPAGDRGGASAPGAPARAAHLRAYCISIYEFDALKMHRAATAEGEVATKQL
jgi:hypothetical protein